MGWGGLWLLSLWILLAAAPTRAESPDAPPLRLVVWHEHRLGPSFRLHSARFVLDGRLLEGAPPSTTQDGAAPALLDVTVERGLHVLELEYAYEGQSPVFNYIDGYRFLMRGRVLLDARPGHVLEVTSTALRQEDLTLEWTRRPAFALTGKPRKLVLDIQASPVEARPGGAEGEGPQAPVLTHTPEQEEALAREAVDAVLREAEALREPPQALDPGCAPVSVHFPFARAELSEEARGALRELGRCLARHPTVRVRIEGHCDVRGSRAANLRLGLRRAAVAAAFLEGEGIAPERLDVLSLGEAQPLCPERTEACHARNRRNALKPYATPVSSRGPL